MGDRRPRSPSLSSSNDNGVDGVVQRCAVYLSLVALALSGLGYDPLQRTVEQKVAAEAEVDAEYEGFYAGIEEELEEEGDLEINYQPNLYVARMLAPALVCGLLAKPVDLQLVRKIYGLGHLLVCLCYVLMMLPENDEDWLLRTCGFFSELFWVGKLVLYYYQIVVYSSPSERLPVIVYGMIVQSFGSVALPWILNGLEEVWPETQYYLNILVALSHLSLFYPIGFCKHAVKASFSTSTNYKFPKLITTSTTISVLLSSLCNVILQWFLTGNETLLRPFQPLLIADDYLATLWNALYTGIGFTFLGFFCLFFPPTQVLIASLAATLAAGASYVYLEQEEIAARLALPATAFTFAVAFALLLEVCPDQRLLVPLVGAIFTVVNAATYAYFGLIRMLWDSPDVTLIVVWAALGFFALAMLVLCRELEMKKEEVEGGGQRQPRDVSSESFQTVITTIA